MLLSKEFLPYSIAAIQTSGAHEVVMHDEQR
jgi:hypothetical protein